MCQVPDALVPHLHATLRMRWDQPPRAVQRRLDALPTTPPSIRSPWLLMVAQRCGSPVDGQTPVEFIVDHADRRSPITFELLQRLQAIVLGEPLPSFRTAPARVAARPERYAWFPGAEAMFRRKVVQDDADLCHPLIKAARLYLDMIYFHPFNDGNARAALLSAMFHCLRAHLALPDPRRLFGFGFVAGNPDAYWAFALMLAEESHGP